MRNFLSLVLALFFGMALVCCTGVDDGVGKEPPINQDTVPVIPKDSIPSDSLVSDSLPKDSTVIDRPIVAASSDIMIVNEGWFGHESGSVNMFSPGSGIFTSNVFKSANGGAVLGTTTQYGQNFRSKIYFVSKMGRTLVACDARSMVESGSLTLDGNFQGYAFAGISASWGVLTCSDGAYVVDLRSMKVGGALPGMGGEPCGGVMYRDGRLFVINRDRGAIIYDADTTGVELKLSVAKQIGGVGVGFAGTVDGLVWCVKNERTLLSINTRTLDVQSVELPVGLSISNPWGAWNARGLVAAHKSNTLYFTQSGNQIYRFNTSDATSMARPFITAAKDDMFYGAGIAVDPQTDRLVATMVNSDYVFDDNRLVIFDQTTGAEILRYTYTGYWFPAIVIFK